MLTMLLNELFSNTCSHLPKQHLNQYKLSTLSIYIYIYIYIFVLFDVRFGICTKTPYESESMALGAHTDIYLLLA